MLLYNQQFTCEYQMRGALRSPSTSKCVRPDFRLYALGARTALSSESGADQTDASRGPGRTDKAI